MENSYQQYHRPGHSGNGTERNRSSPPRDSSESDHVLPGLIMKEYELLYVTEPEKLLSEYMKLRNWTYKIDISSEGSSFKVDVDIESEDIFSQTSNNQKKALVKAIIYVIYHYNSMLCSIWIARHQNMIKEYIR